jgi:hypothetical protein
MSFKLPIETPLTETQSELSAKIGSMNSLLVLSKKNRPYIPKGNQVCSYDFAKKLLNGLGFSLEPLFLLFINKIFDESSDFLEREVLRGMANSLARKGTLLPNVQTPTSDMNEVLIKQYEEQNLIHLRTSASIPANFLSVAKQQIAKSLVLMLFGPKDGPAAEYLHPDPVERQRLIDEAICGSFAFSMSNEPIVREEDLEYNRIALARQLERGRVTFTISCQDVHVTLPQDPSIIFEGGGQYTIPGQTVTPAQSLTFLVQHVGNQVQNINSQANRTSGSRSFFEIMIEKIMGYMSTLVTPHLGPVMNGIRSTSAGANYNREDLVYSTCDILRDPDNISKKTFGKTLANYLYKALLAMMLTMLIREFKKLIANYFRKLAMEKQKRKMDKIRQKFKLLDEASEKAQQAERYAAALKPLNSILSQQA